MSMLNQLASAGDDRTTVVSPITAAPALGRALGVDLRIKRDDLLPIAGGGNKARKAVKIIERAVRDSHDALVTTGGFSQTTRVRWRSWRPSTAGSVVWSYTVT